MRVRHRHLYAVPHHREELMSCLQFGPCEQFKKNRKTHVRFQHCIHQLVLHELRTMGEDHKSIWIPLRCGVLQEWGVWTLCRGEARTSDAYPCLWYNPVPSWNPDLTNNTSITEWTSSFGSSGYGSLITSSEFFSIPSLSMCLIRGESQLFQWWIGQHCHRTWTWYERRMVVLRKWTTTWGSSLWAWRRRGRSWRHFSPFVMENDRIVFGRD